MNIIRVGPPRVATVALEWQEATVIIRVPTKRVHAIDGWVYGRLAVHPTVPEEDEPLVAVTHLPTRLCLCRLTEPDDAVKVAERLWAECRELHQDEPDQTKVAPQLLEWLRRCRLERRVR